LIAERYSRPASARNRDLGLMNLSLTRNFNVSESEPSKSNFSLP
jgi:hypothetical protein